MNVPSWLDVTLRSTIVYAVLLAGLRLAGKRHSGNLSPHDLVLMLLVSNAVQNAMVGTDATLAGGIVAAATLIVLNVLITRLVLHHRHWGPLFAGTPTMLIYNGQVLHDHLQKEEILPAELEAQIRAHGFEDATAVRLAVEECDGSISVIGFGAGVKEQKLPPIPSRRNRLHRRNRRGQ